MEKMAYIKITVNSEAWGGVVSYNAVKMELRDGGIKFWAGGRGYFIAAENVISIEPFAV